MQVLRNNSTLKGIVLAITAALLWSGNFVISRAVKNDISPITLAFYRWLTASIIIFPLAWKAFKQEQAIISSNIKYLFLVSLSGIAVFNTCVYVAGHYTSAINMALIGTTSSPIFATVMAVVFLGMFVADAVYDITLRTSGPLQTISSAEYTITLIQNQCQLRLFGLEEVRELAFVFGRQVVRYKLHA
jgi:threonine/homoserine efflux transporter RhtA